MALPVSRFKTEKEMELLKKMIISACVLSIIISLADSLRLGNGMSRQLKLIFSFVFISGIIASVSGCEFEFELPALADVCELEGYENISDAADRAVLDSAEQSVINMTERILISQGISYEKITADININDDGSININEIGYCGNDFDRAVSAIKSGIGETEVKGIE